MHLDREEDANDVCRLYHLARYDDGLCAPDEMDMMSFAPFCMSAPYLRIFVPGATG